MTGRANLTAEEREADDGPECETCGKTACPDADLPSFSAPVNCEYRTVYEALHDARDCDYGCARDLTNAGVRREVVPAVERIVAARMAAAWDEGYQRGTLDTTSDLDPADNPYRAEVSS